MGLRVRCALVADQSDQGSDRNTWTFTTKIWQLWSWCCSTLVKPSCLRCTSKQRSSTKSSGVEMKWARSKNSDEGVQRIKTTTWSSDVPVALPRCSASVFWSLSHKRVGGNWAEVARAAVVGGHCGEDGEEEQMVRNSRGLFQEGPAFSGSYTHLITKQRGKWASGGRQIFINPTSYDKEDRDHLSIACSAVVQKYDPLNLKAKLTSEGARIYYASVTLIVHHLLTSDAWQWSRVIGGRNMSR